MEIHPQKRSSSTEQTLVYIPADNLTGGADPFTEYTQPAQGAAADIQALPPGRLPIFEQLPPRVLHL